ncbi:hypothetical protein SAMN05880501_104157 [Ureibacillus xyleni]|uniref:YdhG-like domain-containing protein n=1 Tax=Ureibacillus xyleni TaxID=614648 RepID=A0A285SIR4_9BACL|nr:DUF1801 domain-containing protein [Ureibacillus xyleni]SOC06007.1 hypothetical protein SAMN05880501_104157 [Ureibacillus xyleni]
MTNKLRTIEIVDQYIDKLPEEIQQITVELRKIILDSSPHLKEEFKWSMPNYSYNGLVCYLQPAKNHVNLGFHRGNELKNKEWGHFLHGTGKSMRHIQINNMQEIQKDAFTSLIKIAVALNHD